jgi:hypothetical protein
VPPRTAIRVALTKRELEIFTQLASGHSNHKIAYELSVSTNTVANHIASILANSTSKTASKQPSKPYAAASPKQLRVTSSPLETYTNTAIDPDAIPDTRHQQSRTRHPRPPDSLLAKGVPPVLAGSRRLRARTALDPNAGDSF